jgi:hypothetical protein
VKENNENKKSGKVRIFFKGLFEKLDKKMKEKADAREKNSCCSK